MNYCQTCDNTMVPNFINDELTFICKSCNITTSSSKEDSLRKERIKESNILIHENMLNNAANDPVTKKARIKCMSKKCTGNIVKQVEISDEMLLYNICIKCNYIWLNN